jgi:hypothetical protein
MTRLVGSEMCIRDSNKGNKPKNLIHQQTENQKELNKFQAWQ